MIRREPREPREPMDVSIFFPHLVDNPSCLESRSPTYICSRVVKPSTSQPLAYYGILADSDVENGNKIIVHKQ